MLAIATTESDLERLRPALESAGLTETSLVAPAPDRRVVLARPEDDAHAEPAAVALRLAGWMAVSRPDHGARLDAWHDHTRPVVLAGGLSVCPAWSEHERGDLEKVIELGPGGFGSGHHPTTRLVVQALAERVRGGESVLDVGCGSGILALCALALGAASALGLDIDAAAVDAVPRNAEINGFKGCLTATGAPLRAFGGTFDLVVANVARAGIVELADDLVPRVGDGGVLVAGGLSPGQCDQVMPFLTPLEEVDRLHEGDWSAVVLRRR